MTIAILVPTKARPEQFNRMVKSARATSSNVQVYVALACDEVGYDLTGCNVTTVPNGMPTAYKWNKLAEKAHADGCKIFMLGADDTIFTTPLWDNAILHHYNNLENKIHVYHLLDSRNAAGTPHPIATREYIDAMGYFLPPLFMHWFVDSWTVEMAKYCECFTHMTDFLLFHDKPSDAGKPDATHTGIRASGWHERDKWVAEKCQHWLEFEKQRLLKHFSKSARAVA